MPEIEERYYPMPGEPWTKAMLLPRLHIGTTYVIEVDGSRVHAIMWNIDENDCAEFAEVDSTHWAGGKTVKHHFLTWELMSRNPPCSPNQMGYWRGEANV